MTRFTQESDPQPIVEGLSVSLERGLSFLVCERWLMVEVQLMGRQPSLLQTAAPALQVGPTREHRSAHRN